MATFTDAGVLPRANEDEDKNNDIRAPLYEDVEVRGITFRMKWCASCSFYRPPRCSHCSVCDHCVEDFDHHCPWVNNCIGRRNYRFFFLFLLSLSVHMVGIFSGCLLYILEHLETLWELHATVTKCCLPDWLFQPGSDVNVLDWLGYVTGGCRIITHYRLYIMSTSGLFFIPIMGLACFHMVLVITGQTTNEQVTRKYKGGTNPFTRGCCGNVEFVLCSPITPRYTRNLENQQSIHVHPPFQISESVNISPLKVEDNGVQTEMLSVKLQSAGELNVSDRKQRNTLPSLPPKPDPVLLNHQLATLQDNLLQSRTAVPSGQSSVNQTVESPSRMQSYQVPTEQMECMKNLQLHMSGFTQDPYLESGMGQTEKQTPIFTHNTLQSRTHPVNTLILNSRSLTLKQTHCRSYGDHQGPNSVASSATQGILSLSYDSLISPAQRGSFKVNYLPPFLPLDLGQAIRCPTDARHAPCRTYSPGFPDTIRKSPLHHDSLSKPAMSSIQERHELEEREKQQSLLPIQDISVYDMPSGRSLPSRRPSPPAYGSREFLMSSAAYGYASSLRQTSRNSSSSPLANVTLNSRSFSTSSGSSLQRRAQQSITSIPSSSYTAQKTLALITTSERKVSGP